MDLEGVGKYWKKSEIVATSSDLASWGECHLRLARFATEQCLETRTTGSPEVTVAVSCPGYRPSVTQLRICGRSQVPQRCAATLFSRGLGERCKPRFKCGSRARMPAQPRICISVTVVSIPALHPVGVSLQQSPYYQSPAIGSSPSAVHTRFSQRLVGRCAKLKLIVGVWGTDSVYWVGY